ncbi:MAG: hypothetical protein IKC08_03835 [Lentisphaeria bacterium]|nr:hypothetical protein [Lentisphaeria bacterium]
MPILTDSTGKQYERSEAQIERMSAPPITLPYPIPERMPEERKQRNAEIRAFFKKKGWEIPDKYKD